MNFLVAADGSAESHEALRYAAELAAATDASITVVHAVDPAAIDLGGDEPGSAAEINDRLIVEGVEDAEERASRIVDRAVEMGRERGLEIEGAVVYGRAIEAIPAYADQEGFDTIFVGHRGRAGRAGLLLGSVANGIVQRAAVPVTVVR